MLTIVAAAGNAMFYGWLGWFFVKRVGFSGQAKFAGLFLAIGFAIGSFGGHAGSEAESILVLRGVGYLFGVLTFVTLLFHPRVRRLRRDS